MLSFSRLIVKLRTWLLLPREKKKKAEVGLYTHDFSPFTSLLEF